MSSAEPSVDVVRRVHLILALSMPLMIWLGRRSGLPFDRLYVMVVGLASWPAFVWGALTRTRHRRLQGLAALGPIYFLSIIALATIGLAPGAMAALITLVVLSGVFFGRRAAWVAAGVVIATTATIGLAYGLGWFPLPEPAPLNVLSRAVWVRATTTQVVLALVAASAVTAVLARHEQSLVAKQRALLDLKAEQDRRISESDEAIRRRDEFLMIVSHELRTPLTPLLMKSQDLERRAQSGGLAADPEQLGQHIHKIATQVSRLVRLVDELLDVSNAIAGDIPMVPEDVDLVRVLAEVVERSAEALVRSGSALTLSSPDRCVGRWDRALLERVVSNLLLGNAIKYGDGKPIAVELRATPELAVLLLRDSGIGVESTAQERLFRRFGRAASPENYGGFGLGLWLAKRYVDVLGGTIRVESEIGKGATFLVDLPRTAPRGDGAEIEGAG